jgi:hypothetical protein
MICPDGYVVFTLPIGSDPMTAEEWITFSSDREYQCVSVWIDLLDGTCIIERAP